MKAIDLHDVANKELEAQSQYLHRVMCCHSTACLSSGAEATYSTLKQAVQKEGLNSSVQVVPTSCMGLCSHGPLVKIKTRGSDSTLYYKLNEGSAPAIINDHIQKGKKLSNKELSQDIPFFQKQEKVVLANAGEINPESLEHYIARGGYLALEKALTAMTPIEVVNEIRASGLRGRGGGGYPTGKKWALLHEAQSEQKYIIANGDEGDPGAYMDQIIMEDDPHRILEGMAIAAYAVGANSGYLYVRAEYPLAVKRLEQAIRTAKRNKLLGEGILGTDFNLKLEVRVGAGAFVCGEETALMASIEGKRGNPVLRPPYPTEQGLWGQPTMINNVETFANVSTIIQKGAVLYASIGTETSKGTKVFALAGNLNNTGPVEVPMGISLHEIIYDIGDGIPEGKVFKAAQTGGPSGGCIPADHLNTPVDYENLQALGSIMGSGGLIVMNDDVRMPDIAKYFMEFCMEESCGKCVPCRAGTVQMYQILDKICKGEATKHDLDLLEQLCDMVSSTSLCGLGQAAPNPVISTLHYFRQEYEELLKEPAYV